MVIYEPIKIENTSKNGGNYSELIEKYLAEKGIADDEDIKRKIIKLKNEE